MPTKSPVTELLQSQLHNNPGKPTFRMMGMKPRRSKWNRRKILSALRRSQNG